MVNSLQSPDDPFHGRLNRVGGELSLDFTNTVSWHGAPQAEEWLSSYRHLVAWARLAGVLEAEEADLLVSTAESRPGEATRVLGEAIELREALFRIFRALGEGSRPSSQDLETLNRVLTDAYAHLELTPAASRFDWRWRWQPQDLSRPLWPVARSAADLLASDRLDRVKECSGEHCGWLFLDMSKNRSRRWCDMGDCGNRAKAKRHYERLRARLEAPATDASSATPPTGKG